MKYVYVWIDPSGPTEGSGYGQKGIWQLQGRAVPHGEGGRKEVRSEGGDKWGQWDGSNMGPRRLDGSCMTAGHTDTSACSRRDRLTDLYCSQVQKLCDRYIADVDQLKLLKDKDLKDNH